VAPTGCAAGASQRARRLLLLAAGCWLLAAGCWLLLMLLVVVSLDLQLAMLAAGAVAGWHWLLARQRARS
jgi:hypothetical protein